MYDYVYLLKDISTTLIELVDDAQKAKVTRGRGHKGHGSINMS